MSPLASIPSPESGNLGPFHMYGIVLAIGVLIAVYVAERRWRNRGHPREGIYDIAFWVVVWGVIGAGVRSAQPGSEKEMADGESR